jgi:hypothetical protein
MFLNSSVLDMMITWFLDRFFWRFDHAFCIRVVSPALVDAPNLLDQPEQRQEPASKRIQEQPYALIFLSYNILGTS